ncbi:helix-turn-helix domain-containing protein [Marinobacter sp.]|uniref:helix-turn-helix domain-containing protein n=1 Tax=Marinobacter sp. TaxID=50741 RepID=UPI003A9205FC
MEEHYGEAVNLQSLAALSGLTTRSLIRRFKLATGDTPTGYLQAIRAEAARQALENTRLPVEDVPGLLPAPAGRGSVVSIAVTAWPGLCIVLP